MKKKLTRLFSVLLAAVLVFGTLPVSAMGTDVADPPASAVDDASVDVSAAEPEEEASAVDETPDGEEVSTQAAEDEVVATYASSDVQYKIVHLDCGRKYFSKDWIIALLYEMQNDGYNQLQLAFGNDGLRFLLDDMSFTANGTTYDNDTVVAKVKAGNKAQNSSGDESYLTESEMDEIIAKAKELGIEIVPLLNLPGHANAILDIANDAYNASGSNNTLNVADTNETTAAAAQEFGMAIFKKYVDYFAGKGCKFFNFGADEYANDASGTFSFSRLNSTQYQTFVSFINDLAGYIIGKGMTPRAFNDGLYYNGQEINTSKYANITKIQCCYWSSGWGSYPVASASTISNNGHEMINTNGDFYYVLGKSDKFDSDYSYASNFTNSGFMGSTINNPVGSMFCIWCDYPNAETEKEVAQKTRLVLRAMAQRMNNENVNVSDDVVANGFEADGSINVPEDPDKVVITVSGNGSKLVVDSSVEMAASKKVRWTASNDNVEITPVGGTAAYSTDVEATVVNVKALAAGEVTITAIDPANESNTDSVTLDVVEEAFDKEINLTVGGTYDVELTGSYPGPHTPDSTAIATVDANVATNDKITYEAVTSISAGEFYVSSKRNDTNPTLKMTLELANSSNNSSTYYINNATGYTGYIYPNYTYSWNSNSSYTLETGKQSVRTNKSGNGFQIYRSVNGGRTAYLQVNDNNEFTAGGSSILYLYKQNKTEGTATTTITFTGKSVGTTYVTIAGTKYKITVSPTPLTIEYWITNRLVQANGVQQMQISTTATGVNSEAGVAAKDILPANANVVADNASVVYWKTTKLDSAHKQTEGSGVDQTLAGVDFSYIRYWENKWSYSIDGENWTAIDTASEQLVAYYLQWADVTQEVTTKVVDWGPTYDEWVNNRNRNEWFWNGYVESGSSYCVMDFAVVYEDNTQNPDSFPVDNTTFFHCDGGSRTVGIVNFEETAQYEIWKVTVTDGTTSGYTSSSSFKVAYDDATEETVWTTDMGGDPRVEKTEYDANRSAKLIRVYVRAKKTEDSLTVNYIDDTTGETFYHYNIAVESGTTFSNPFDFDGTSNVVKNFLGVDQIVTDDLSKMSEIGAQYRYAAYKRTSFDLADENKTLNIHYNFTRVANFVIDFGTPLKISPSDIKDTLGNANITSVEVSGDNHGTAAIDEKYNVIYTPDARFASSEKGETLQITYKGTQITEEGTKDGKISYTVYIHPASNVLYEENFLKVGEKEQYTSDAYTWTEDKGDHSKQQQTQKTTDTDKFTFGYDSSYDSVTDENGAWEITDLNIRDLSVPLTTTFYGNGFDLIGNCANDSGRVMIMIKGEENKLIVVDTRYNDGNGGTTVLNQVPLAHVVMSKEGTYEVKVYTAGLDPITVNETSNQSLATASLYEDYTADDMISEILEANDLSTDDVEIVTTAMSQDGVASPVATMSLDNVATYATTVVPHPAGTHVEINGFRVYRSSAVSETTDDDTATKPVANNYPEAEQNKTYWNILDVVQGKITAYTEADNEAVSVSVEEYEGKGGPQNEIFLTNEHAVQFQIEKLSGKTIYVSLRAVKNATKYNGEAISSVTEMYYPITANAQGIFTIRCDGSNMLAIGNVKLPSEIKAADIKAPSEVSTDVLVAALNEVLHGDEEKEVFTPETFKVTSSSTKLVKNKVVTLKINVSSDVAYVTVNGVKYTRSGLQGLFQKTRTIRVVKTVPKNEEKSYEIIAYNADGVASETTTITVK